jgi:hypothetical protein
MKLIDCDISCKLLDIIKSIYASVQSCLNVNTKLTDLFDVTIGLKQGEPLSPLFFILFINDMILDKCHQKISNCYLNTYCYLQMKYCFVYNRYK